MFDKSSSTIFRIFQKLIPGTWKLRMEVPPSTASAVIIFIEPHHAKYKDREVDLINKLGVRQRIVTFAERT